MKYCFTTLALFLGLFSATIALGQNETSKKLRSTALINTYPVSGTVSGSDSTQYYFDDNGRITDEYWWSDYTPAGGWHLYARVTAHTYDANGNLLSTLRQLYDENLGWIDFERNTYEYDSKNSLVGLLEERFKDSTGWVNNLRFFNSYDTVGNRLSSVVENWRDTVWVLNNAQYFTYDAAGNVLTRTNNNLYRTIYAWDGAGNKLSETYVHFDSGLWVTTDRRIYLYGFNPQLPAIEIWFQDWGNSTWNTRARQKNTYDTSGDLTEILYQRKSGSGWLDDYRYQYEYNQNHQEVFQEYQEWVNGAWSKHTRYFTAYDADGDIILVQRRQWNGAWYGISVQRFHYDETLPTHTPQLDDFLLFPNPTTDVVTLKGSNMLSAEIFNVKGELVSSSPLFGADETTLQLGSIPAGNYFLRLLMKDGSVSTKSFQVRQ